MPNARPRFAGVELYFDDLVAARQFYAETLGLQLSEEQPDHHAKFDSGAGFVCLERRGVETYPSRDKAVLFFEVPDLAKAVETIGRDRFAAYEQGTGPNRGSWAVLHDPEGHNVILLERQSRH